MKKLIEGLKRFRDREFKERQAVFERSAGGQRPQALLITCSDSRVLPETLMQVDPGDLFVSRNAGNLVPPPDVPSGESATIEYAVSALGIREIIVCGHYRCGAVRAMLHPDEGPCLEHTQRWLDLASADQLTMQEKVAHLEPDARWDAAVERNVLAQIESLARHPVVAAGLADGTVRIHAWTLRFETSEVFAYDERTQLFKSITEAEPTQQSASPWGDLSDATDDDELSVVKSEAGGASAWRHDVAASLTVFMVALPLCLAIAKACGIPAEVGLVTGIVGGVVVGLLGGSALQVTGPSAGLVVILIDAFQRLGWEALGAVTLLAGAMQIAAAALRLGGWFRAVSPSVVIGMLAGIGCVIFAQQFHLALDDTPAPSFVGNVIEIPRALFDIVQGHVGHVGHLAAALTGVLTLSVLLLWGRIAPSRMQKIPSVLVAVTLAGVAAYFLGLPVQTVEFRELSDAIRWIDVGAATALFARFDVWATAFVIASVASAESLLCAAALDRMHDGARSRLDRELAAQGLGNAICGLLGALPLSGAIVRSSTNLQAGARTSAATVFHGLWLLIVALAFPDIFGLIPAAALAAVLVFSGIKLIDVGAMRSLWSQSRSEMAICVATAATVAFVDLLSGVVLGIALSVVKLIAASTRLSIRHHDGEGGGRTRISLEGDATFLRLPSLAAALERLPRGHRVEVDLAKLRYVDHACLTLLTDWRKQQERSGGLVNMDETALRARYARSRFPKGRTDSIEETEAKSDFEYSRRAA